MNILAAALEDELQAFPDHLPGWERLVTGIGRLNAATALTERLLAAPGARVVVVGTAGTLDPALPAGVHPVGAVLQHDVWDFEHRRGLHVALPARFLLSGDITVATGDSFTDSAEQSAQIRRLGADMVDMESYAFAWAAHRQGAPLAIARVASDGADAEALHTWDETVARCSTELWDWFRSGPVDDPEHWCALPHPSDQLSAGLTL